MLKSLFILNGIIPIEADMEIEKVYVNKKNSVSSERSVSPPPNTKREKSIPRKKETLLMKKEKFVSADQALISDEVRKNLTQLILSKKLNNN
jgi:hypothetical protein